MAVSRSLLVSASRWRHTPWWECPSPSSFSAADDALELGIEPLSAGRLNVSPHRFTLESFGS